MKRTSGKKVKRIGILLIGIEEKTVPALQYLILHINSLQSAFEYEFLPIPRNDKLIIEMSSGLPLNREEVRQQVKDFTKRYIVFLERLMVGYKLGGTVSDRFVIVSTISFTDNYYTMRQDKLSVIALGNWKTVMAPPSILEFILSLVVRESVAAVAPSLRGSVHLGTKGCLEDFTASLKDARYKILNAFVCEQCRDYLKQDGYPNLADELITVLDKKWLGNPSEPNSPANIAKKLGYNLFTTKGYEPTFWETFINLIQDEGIKQLIVIIGTVIAAVLTAFLIFRLGLK